MKARFFVKNLFMLLVPLLVPVVILGTLSIVVTGQYIQGEINQNNLVLFNQIDRNMELITDEMNSLSVSLGNSEVVFRLGEILRTQTLTLDNLRLMKTMLNYINGPANAKPYISSIYVYVDNPYRQFLVSGQGLVKLDEFLDPAWMDSFASHPDRTGIWTESRRIKRYSFEAPVAVTTLYRNLVSSVQNRPSGVIMLNIDTAYMEKLLTDMTSYPGQTIYILDENGRSVFRTPSQNAPSLDELGPASYSDRSVDRRTPEGIYRVSQYTSKSGWTYISVTPRKSLNRIPFKLSALTLFFVLLSFMLGLAITWMLTRRSVNHIRRIIALIRHAEAGSPPPDIAAGRKTDEYGYIAQRIVAGFIERQSLGVQLTEKKYKLRAAELLALQAQINPHFLFNTLETIYWKVLGLTGMPNEANRMLDHLSALLRYSLDTPNEIVPLEREIESAKMYLRIQQVRYRESFEAIWQYDPEELQGAGIARLLLQPLIENCMSHGLRERRHKLRIKIKLMRLSGAIRIAVIDDGPGMDAQLLREVRSRIESEDEVYRHIGLANTDKRIKLTYDSSEGLTIRSKPGLGTVISMTIPFLPPAGMKG